jgi:undecaprenyl-diphosphatase
MIFSFDKILKIDRKINQSLAAYNLPWLSGTLGALTYLGTGAVWIAAYAFFLFFLPDPLTPLIWTLVLCEVMGLFAIIVLRYITKRARPATSHKHFFLTPWNRYSFPSHHAYRVTILLIIFGTAFPALLSFLIVMAATVCFSRIYLAKHYFSDVLTGIFLGIILAMVSQRIIHIGSLRCLTK